MICRRSNLRFGEDWQSFAGLQTASSSRLLFFFVGPSSGTYGPCQEEKNLFVEHWHFLLNLGIFLSTRAVQPCVCGVDVRASV